jgi:hypothetical protein
MSRYGIDYYGVGKYGNPAIVEYDVSPFITRPVGYGKIDLTWTKPNGEWTSFRLVRNSYGFPVDPDDGDVLSESLKATSPSAYSDKDLIEGRTYYYSIFVQTDQLLWIRAGNVYGVSVKNFNSYEKMYTYLPGVHRTLDRFGKNVSNDPNYVDDQENKDLQDFIKLLAFEYDLEKTLSTNVMYSYDTTFVDGRYIPQMMKQFGVKFEPEIGLKQSRILLRNALKIYKTKGSRDGLTTYLKAYTGYDTTVTVGKNLFLDYNNSSFEEGIGFWTATAATISKDSVTPAYVEATAPAAYPNLQNGVLKTVVTTAGTVTLSCGLSAPITRGIPVSPALAYTFSIYGRAATTARTATLTIKWYDRFGALISTSTDGTGVSITSSEWARVKAANKVAPALAAFAVPVITLASTTLAEVFYFDAAQFEQAADATNFEEARVLKINFLASRKNELLNPNFQGTASWSVTGGTKVSSSTLTGVPVFPGAGQSLVVRPASVAPVTVKSENVLNLTPNTTYTFSVYAEYFNEGAGPTPTDTVFASIQWRDSSGNVLKSNLGAAYSHAGTSGWIRPNVTSTAPATFAYATVSVVWAPSSTSVSLVLDQALFEESPFVNTYFDGNTGVSSLANLDWEGTPNLSKSQYYRNREVTEVRLNKDLPNYLTAGTTFQIYFFQP